jgi:hypothetical protein
MCCAETAELNTDKDECRDVVEQEYDGPVIRTLKMLALSISRQWNKNMMFLLFGR